MQLVLLIQSGDDGSVRIVGATDKNLERVVDRLQLGNPEWLHIRAVLDGDERLEGHLGHICRRHEIVRGWYDPIVLSLVPGDVAHWGGFDEADERRRMAAARLTAGY